MCTTNIELRKKHHGACMLLLTVEAAAAFLAGLRPDCGRVTPGGKYLITCDDDRDYDR